MVQTLSRLRLLRGDDLRQVALSYYYPHPDAEGNNAGFDVQNFNKKGLAINLKDPEGMEAFLKLLETADVFRNKQPC